ncbi:MAG: BolA/IbaG family iron-sulfur metabolism protein, partial [Proteobacteria bacterium]|nr:BolA/IbaG family iron-sulfur metabolism protein [Pseudomonadota bacterium]
MPVNPNDIRTLLQAAFPQADITVSGEDGVHLHASVTAYEFDGLSRVAQQRLVYAALKGAMDGQNADLHAL